MVYGLNLNKHYRPSVRYFKDYLHIYKYHIKNAFKYCYQAFYIMKL